MFDDSSTYSFFTFLPFGPVWLVTKVLPKIWSAACFNSSKVLVILIPPAFPLPPECIWALRTYFSVFNNFVLFSICSVLNLYSHYHSIIVTISCFIYVLLISDKSLYKPLSLCFCFIFITYSFWLSSFYEHFFEYSNLGCLSAEITEANTSIFS